MNIYKVIENIYTNKSSKWIYELSNDDIKFNEISNVIIQKFLCMNDAINVQVRFLDKYTYNIPTKMFISLAWSITPKYNKNPFVLYIKKKTEEEEFDFILKLVKKHLQMADNDYNSQKKRIINYIKNDMINWFSFYGIPKKYWRQYYLDFNKMKDYNVGTKLPVSMGLAKWGIK